MQPHTFFFFSRFNAEWTILMPVHEKFYSESCEKFQLIVKKLIDSKLFVESMNWCTFFNFEFYQLEKNTKSSWKPETSETKSYKKFSRHLKKKYISSSNLRTVLNPQWKPQNFPMAGTAWIKILNSWRWNVWCASVR